MSVLERCPSYREPNKGSKGRQGGTLGVRLIESQIKGVKKKAGTNSPVKVSLLQRCPFRESRLLLLNKGNESNCEK